MTDDIEIVAWFPGAPVKTGVMAVHAPTGAAVLVKGRPSRALQERAVERLKTLLAEAHSVGMWRR